MIYHFPLAARGRYPFSIRKLLYEFIKAATQHTG